MKMANSLKLTLIAAALASSSTAYAASQRVDGETVMPDVSIPSTTQFIPVLGVRVGTYGVIESSVFNGMMDYFQMVNERDGGIGGVKLSWKYCETANKAEQAVACYEKMKKLGSTGAAVFSVLGDEPAHSIKPLSVNDKIPLIMMGGGVSATSGTLSPYAFTVPTGFYSQTAAILQFIKKSESGSLAGKKIAIIHSGSHYGRESLPLLKAAAAKEKFTLVSIEVAEPGFKQTQQWKKISSIDPDWVILRTGGAMTKVALHEAAQVGFPRINIVGDSRTNVEEEVQAAGKDAVGFITSTSIAPGTPGVFADIKKNVYDKFGFGNMEEGSSFRSVNYNRGLAFGVIITEGIRSAQSKFGNKPLTGEQVRWGLEHLNLNEEKLKAMGVKEILPAISTSCGNHEGSGKVKFQKWKGTEWGAISEWMEGDKALIEEVRGKEKAANSGKQGETSRDCGKEI